ncbi:MAG: B12-binding domain-containing radical SAM protein [Candidatus Krumholzibacteriota bacterium]|nr:B12-binding domain-containing radical SAM protein [Candidatus Krumholzibacteriota bacterium]
MKPKVVLIRPMNPLSRYTYPRNSIFPPMALLCLGSALNDICDLRIIDCLMERDYKKLILSECINASLVGITAMTSEVPSGIDISDMIKAEYPDMPVVWGGIHPTFYPKQTCEDDSIDFVIVEEGEHALRGLLTAIHEKQPFNNINGLLYKSGGEVIRNNSDEYMNLDNSTPVNYDLVDIRQYTKKTLLSGMEQSWLPYQSSRGCPYRCVFCHNSILQRGYRKKNADKVVEELENMIQNYNLKSFSFMDDNFFVDPVRVEAICRNMVRRNFVVKWSAECRANYFGNILDDSLLILLRKAGWASTTIGAESGSQRILELLKKDILVGDILKAAEMCHKYSIIPNFSFITGIPGETREDTRLTMEVIKRVKEICPRAFISITNYFLVPGCELYETLVERKEITAPESLRDWKSEEYQRMFLEGYTSDKYRMNVAFYHNLGSVYNGNEIRKALFKFKIWTFPYLFFVIIAKLRLKYSIYSFSIDIRLFRIFSTLFHKARNII